MSRGQLPVLRTPETGVAAAKCLLSREFSLLRVTGSHQTTCRFCSFTDEELAIVVDEFNKWAGIDTGQLQPTVEAFSMLPIDTQRRLSAQAAQPTTFKEGI